MRKACDSPHCDRMTTDDFCCGGCADPDLQICDFCHKDVGFWNTRLYGTQFIYGDRNDPRMMCLGCIKKEVSGNIGFGKKHGRPKWEAKLTNPTP